MKTTNIAQLKAQLSAYLAYVQDGEEVLVKDRNKPIAKIVPLHTPQSTSQELVALAAAGLVKLPEVQGGAPKSLRSIPKTRLIRKSMSALMKEDRDGR
jgi:prevent-host-death family protein